MDAPAFRPTKSQAAALLGALDHPTLRLPITTHPRTIDSLERHGLIREVDNPKGGFNWCELNRRGLDEARKLQARAAKATTPAPADAPAAPADAPQITREDVILGVADAMQWLHGTARQEAVGKPASVILAGEFKRAGAVMRRLLKAGGRPQVENQAVTYYTRVTALLAAARRFEAEDGAAPAPAPVVHRMEVGTKANPCAPHCLCGFDDLANIFQHMIENKALNVVEIVDLELCDMWHVTDRDGRTLGHVEGAERADAVKAADKLLYGPGSTRSGNYALQRMTVQELDLLTAPVAV